MTTEERTGYLSPLYAASLAEFGYPVELPRSRAWVLKRPVGVADLDDAIGIYPRLTCEDWTGLLADIETLSQSIVCLSFVTDVFTPLSLSSLTDTCDTAFEYKTHHLVDFESFREETVSRGARYRARRGLKAVRVDLCDKPLDYLDDWVALYEQLIARHSITGIQRFSRLSFERQFLVPGLLMFRATHAGQTVGIYLVYIAGDVAYYHLAAYNETGYSSFASYALQWTVLEYLKTRVRWLDLGAAPGMKDTTSDGLSRFKRAWANAERRAIFCGKICDREAYTMLCKTTNTTHESFFPAYRSGGGFTSQSQPESPTMNEEVFP